MKNHQMLIFLSIVLSIYTIGNIYLYTKLSGLVPAEKNYRLIFLISFLVLALTFIAGKFLEAIHSSLVSDILNVAGGFWMAFMLYGFIFFLLTDISGFVIKVTGVGGAEFYQSFKKWSVIISTGLAVLFIVAGFINAVIPAVTKYNISIPKNAGNISELKIAAVSDLHIGSTIRKRSIRKLSDLLDKEKPDVVFLLGDIVDGAMEPVLRSDLLSHFRQPATKYGLFAITGNHEFIGGGDRTIPYIESKGIRLLRDETIIIGDSIQVTGRIDRDSRRFFGSERKALSELLKETDPSIPVIVLDHQPLRLDEAEKNGVDLQLSGHTHNGQMWPLNYLTKKIYEVSYGHLKKGNTHIIVSSGYGLWGPRVRSGSRSEIVIVNLRFEPTVK